VPSITVIRTIAAVAFLAAVGSERASAADDIDALFLGGYWCRTEETEKSENIPRNRSFLLSRQIEGPKTEDAFTERLIDVVGDVRGQRVILAQKLKLPDGKECKTDCLTAQRIVNKDLLEFGEWNSNTGVFKSFSPRDYLYRCEK
jgi:hypothetical protein